MDVVRAEVEGMGGDIQISSEPRRGSLVRLSLPLSRAVIACLKVRCGQQTFGVPPNHVLRVQSSLAPVHGGGRIEVLGRDLPMESLQACLGLPEPSGGQQFFVVLRQQGAAAEAGLDLAFVQDNHSRSQKGVLRGMHFQNPGPQGKLVRVVRGAVFDAVVDLRRSSPTFGQWTGVTLSAENKRMFWVPEGFAHGFLTLEDDTDFLYKCTAPYAPRHEHSLAWDDPAVGIEWPLEGVEPQLSAKDKAGLALGEIEGFA
jgi:dTDP-4-dehydrorhamnose 3,5-epimerase